MKLIRPDLVLPDTELRSLVTNQAIIQPSSIEIELSDQYAIMPASRAPSATTTVRDMIADLDARVRQVPDEGVLLAPGVIALVKTNLVLRRHADPSAADSFHIPVGHSALASPKSSIGRIDLFCRTLTDRQTRYDLIEPNLDPDRPSEIWLEIVPLSFPVVFNRGDRLSQLRLHRRNAAARDPVQPEILTLGLTPLDGQSVIGYRSKRCHDPIILSGKAQPADPTRYFDAITNGRRSLILYPDEFYLLKTDEAVSVSQSECAQIAATEDTIGEWRSHYAGFVDSFFQAPTIVLEVRVRDVPIYCTQGTPLAAMTRYELSAPAEKGYGAAIGSHYNGQGLKLSKYFGPYTVAQ